MKTDDRCPFSLAISGSSYGYKNTSGTFVAFRGDSTDTYTYATNSTGGTVDLGARNNYRYVNASNVYTKGKADGVTVHSATYTPTSRNAKLDMGSSHSYRYVNTNSVPNTNSGTYTFASGSTGAQVDLGATNTYRYVNATNVYAKGKADGKSVISLGKNTGTAYLYTNSSSLTGITVGSIVVVTCILNGIQSVSGMTLLLGSNSKEEGLYVYKTTSSTISVTATNSAYLTICEVKV